MDSVELIDSAAKKVGGISALARELQWDKGNIARIKGGKRPMPPYRAAQIAKLLGRDEDAAAWKALADQAKEPERSYWLGKIKKLRSDFAIICVTFLALFAGHLPRAEAAITAQNGIGAEYTLCVLYGGFLGKARSFSTSFSTAFFSGYCPRQKQGFHMLAPVL